MTGRVQSGDAKHIVVDLHVRQHDIGHVADAQIVTRKLGNRYLTEIAKINVTLNPRYGVLDQGQKTIVSDESGSLAKPASPSPTP